MHYLNSAVHEGDWSASRPGRFTPTGEAPGTHWIGGWVDAVVMRNIPSSHCESNPRTPNVQSVT
jgi:hypothetical protein